MRLPAGHTTTRRAQPKQSAVRRGDSNRAATIRRTRCRHDPRSHGRRRTAGRTSGCTVEIPWIACGAAPDKRRRLALERKLGRRRLAEDHQPRIEKPLHNFCMPGRRPMAQRPAPGGGRHAGVILCNVLDQKRHTGERTLQRHLHPLARHRIHRNADGRDLRIHLGRSCHRSLQYLCRRNIAAGDQLGQTARVVAGVFLEHGRLMKTGWRGLN